MPVGTSSAILVEGLLVGYCKLPSIGLNYQTIHSNGYEIENGNSIVDPATLTVGQTSVISALAFSTTTLGQRSNFQIGFKIPSIIEASSYIMIKLPNFKVYSYSTCSVNTNFAYAYNCRVIEDVESYFKVTFQQMVPADTVMTFSATGIQNPKLEGQYSLSLAVHSSQGCLYAEGSAPVTVSGKSTSTQLEILPSNTFLNSYSEVIVKLTPAEPHWASSDYIILEVPYGLSSDLVCKGHSSSIHSMTCSQHNITALRLTLSVDDTAYQSNKTLQFSVAFTLNPPQAGNNANFKSSVCTTTGTGSDPRVFEHSPTFTGINFENQMAFNYAKVNFSSNLRGYADYVMYNASVNSLVAQGSAVQLIFSDKFTNLSNSKLISSAPSMTLNKENADGRIIFLELRQSAALGSSILFTLSMTNPVNAVISPSDIQVKLLQGSSRSLLSSGFPVKDSISFVCDKNCQDCGQIYNQCTRCEAEMTLTDTKCVPTASVQRQQLVVKSEKSIPFICLGVGIILCLIVLLWGCLCRRRLFWGNMLYSLMRPVHTTSLILFLFFSYENDESYWVVIAAIVIIGIHLVMSIAGSVFTMRAIGKATLGAQASDNRFLNALVDNYREKSKSKTKYPRFALTTAKILSPAVGFGVFRWFFSSSKQSKGYFWYFDTPSFNFIKSVLQRFQMLHIFLVHIGTIIVVSISLAQTIYLFKIETVSVSILDLLVYVIAYFELNPLSLKKSQKKNLSKEEVNKEVETYMKIKDQNVSQIQDKSKLEDDSNVQEVNPTRRSKPDEDAPSHVEKSLETESLNSLAKKRLKRRPRDTDDMSEQSEDTATPILKIPYSLDNVTFGTGKSLAYLMKKDDCKRDSAHVPHFDSTVSIPLARSTANYGEKSSQGKEHCYLSQHKPMADLGSNLNPRPISSRRLPRAVGHLESKLDVIYETFDGDDTGGKWMVVKGEPSYFGYQRDERDCMTDSGDSKLTSPPSRVVEPKRARPIEIIGEEDCYREVPVLKDKKGRILNLARRTEDGAFILDNGEKIYLQFKSEDDLTLGRITDSNQVQRNISDQDFSILAKEGKLFDEKGRVVDINGQNPGDIESNLVTLGDGTTFNLNAQKEGLLKKGMLLRTDGTCLNTKIPQERSMMSRGLMQGADGQIYRMIDQTAVALRASELKQFGACKSGEPRAPKKPNKANFVYEEISEDDPFRAEPSRTQSSLLLVKGKEDSLKAGLFDSRFNKAKRQVNGLIDDDFSEYMGGPLKDKRGLDPESNDHKTATMNLSRAESRPDPFHPYATYTGQHQPNRAELEKTLTNEQSLKFIPDSPYRLKLSNFINSSGMVRDSPTQGDFLAENGGEIQSEVGEKSEETLGGSLKDNQKPGQFSKISPLRVGRTPKRQNTDTLGAKPGNP